MDQETKTLILEMRDGLRDLLVVLAGISDDPVTAQRQAKELIQKASEAVRG